MDMFINDAKYKWRWLVPPHTHPPAMKSWGGEMALPFISATRTCIGHRIVFKRALQGYLAQTPSKFWDLLSHLACVRPLPHWQIKPVW